MRYIRSLFIALTVLSAVTFLTLFPGEASVRWLGYQIDFPVALLWISLMLVVICTVSALRLWDVVIHMPQRVQYFLEKRRTKKAEQMLLEGLTALAAQQLDEASSCVAFAQKLIPSHPLTAYVAAQSAHLAQDKEQARASFIAMTQHASIAFLGYRGLIRQAQDAQDWARVQQLLQTVYDDRPDSPWVVQNILKNSLYLAEKETLEVETHALLKSVYRAMSKPESKHHESLVLWLQAKLALGEKKQSLLHQAHESDPSVIYATTELVDLLVAARDIKQARKVIKKTTSSFVHRSLYSAWRHSHHELTPVLFYALLEKELAFDEYNAEVQWLLMRAAIEAHMWGQSEVHGQSLIAEGDDRDVCLAMAGMFATMSGSVDQQATVWQARALDAMWTYFWVCKTCSVGRLHWYPICSSCHGTDTLVWKRQPLKEALNVSPYIVTLHQPALISDAHEI